MKEYRVIGDASYFDDGESVIEDKYVIFDNIEADSSEEAINIVCIKENLEDIGQFTAVEIIEGYSLDIPAEEGYYFVYGADMNRSKIDQKYIVYCKLQEYEEDVYVSKVFFPKSDYPSDQNDLLDDISFYNTVWYFDKNRIEIKEMRI